MAELREGKLSDRMRRWDVEYKPYITSHVYNAVNRWAAQVRKMEDELERLKSDIALLTGEGAYKK